MTAKTRKHVLPKADERGRVRPCIGVRPDGKKAKIEVGNIKHDGQSEMARRLNLIRSLYDQQCQRSQIENWNHWTFNVAKKIGRGETITDEYLETMFDAVTVAGVVSQLRRWGIPVESGEIHAEGMAINQQQIEAMIADAVQKRMAELQSIRGAVAEDVFLPHDPLTMTETASFYETLESYKQHLQTINKDSYKKAGYRKNIRQHTEDFPIRTLNTPKWQGIISTWTQRPNTKRGTRGSKDWAGDVVGVLKHYAKWLHTEPQFRWTKPDGFDDVDCKVIDLKEDEKGSIFQTISKETYTPEQLATICESTDPYWRTIIAVCVNCAFGQSEIGQWQTRLIALNQEHPHAAKIGWETSKEDSWIVGPRPKKPQCYGEHLLWPEVADAVRTLLQDGREVLAVTKTGKPMWMKDATHPQSQIDSRFNNLIARIRKTDPNFPKLPFGSLRDTLPDQLRKDFSDDLASLALQHQTYPQDKLLKCYANLPFAKLFKATQDLREHFRPMLDALSK